MAKVLKKSGIHMKFITPPMIASYPSVFETSEDLDGNQKYSISLLIDKGDVDGVKAIKKAIGSAAKAKWGDDKEKWPKNIYNPLRDGDKEEKEGIYKGKMFMKAKSGTKPSVVDKSLNPIIDKDEFYPGCICRVSINFFGYDEKGIGVALGLNHVMKLKDGERLDGRSPAEDDFANFAEADDDDELGDDIEETEAKPETKKTVEEVPEDDDEGFLD